MNGQDYDYRKDMLAEIFRMQSSLNDYVFSKNRLRDDSGNPLSMKVILDAVNNKQLGANDIPNVWLSRYAVAMDAELEELKQELRWKWWSKDNIDLQNIRVELIDILHFLVSAMICAGLSPEQVFDIYSQKHAVNLKRQNQGYNQASKTEDDNKGIS